MTMASRPVNTIDAAEVNAALGHTHLVRGVLCFAEVHSTNDLALEAAQRGAGHGVWVADAQTAGRGRGGNAWHSAPGEGLYVSALVRPRLPASASLSLVAGLAAWEAIQETAGITADIRWPNDLVTRSSGADAGPARKLGGILVETAIESADAGGPARLRYAVIGIGINVGHAEFPPELANLATSLRREGWRTPDPQRLLIALLARLDLDLGRLEDSYAGYGSGPDVLARLDEASTWLRGKRVHVPEEGGYTGVTAGLDPRGFLLVDSDDGVRRTVRSGGVREI